MFTVSDFTHGLKLPAKFFLLILKLLGIHVIVVAEPRNI